MKFEVYCRQGETVASVSKLHGTCWWLMRAGCSKAEPKNFTPPQTPFPGARDGQNLISWRWSLPSPTDTVWWRSMYAISSYRGTDPQSRKHTNKQTGPM